MKVTYAIDSVTVNKKPHLSIVIPAFNEESRILPSLEKVHAFLRKQSFPSEVLIINDGSLDQTSQIVEAYIEDKKNFRLSRGRVNLGKGGAVRKGMLMAEGDFVLFSDADLSTPIEEVRKMLSLMESIEIAFGSRRIKGSRIEVQQPFMRRLSGMIFGALVRLLLLPGVQDTQCGFKLFTRKAARAVCARQTIAGFGFDAEMLFIAKRLGFAMKEVPVTWRNSEASKVSMLRDPLRMFIDILRIRWNDARGIYD